MTPAARIQAAIDILDQVLSGDAAEKALIRWARASRFAGSGDRAAVRDHVFDALRRRRSYTAIGGGSQPSGRAIMLGALKTAAIDPDQVFTGENHAPPALSDSERSALNNAPDVTALDELVALDCPDWLGPILRKSLGAAFGATMKALRERAPVFLRVNEKRATLGLVQRELARDGIISRPHLLSRNALEVVENARRIQKSHCYETGLIELQDVSPQAAVDLLPLQDGMRVLDFCAGGGGKILAIAARMIGEFYAHDTAPARLRDLPERAGRAGADIRILSGAEIGKRGPFDLVLADVPCSGSGTWRRTPDAKWNLTPERLSNLLRIQAEIIDNTTKYVKRGGFFSYMTCSLLQEENCQQVAAFTARNPGWHIVSERIFSPENGGDGFYCATLERM